MKGHGRPSHSRRSRASDGESAVTPVIGAILILAITILGIAGVLYWGAPMIDRIQAQNAQVAVVGEFQDLRDATTVLSVPDHSRFPTIVIPRGDLNLKAGTRIMVTADRDNVDPYRSCDFHVTNWADTATATRDDVTIGLTGCRTTGSTVQIYSVSGATLVAQTVAVAGTTYTVASADFGNGDWLFRLANSACPSSICAEAWLHSGDKVTWDHAGSTGSREVAFESGAIFSDADGTLYLEREAVVGDNVFGSDYYGFWLRSLAADAYSGATGGGSYQVYLSLLGNYDRVESPSTTRLRFDVAGDLSEGWCNALVSRSSSLSGASYESEVADCGTIAGTTERSVCYARVASAPCAATLTFPSTPNFTFRFLHARIYTSIAL